LAHHHPNREMLASVTDIVLTSKHVSGGEILSISFHDHLIIRHMVTLALGSRR
jgi:DNA repair protein RadC